MRQDIAVDVSLWEATEEPREGRGGLTGYCGDQRYCELILEPLRKSRAYRPKMGTGTDVDLPAFEALYGADPLYSWFGLNSSSVYAAHRAAGGITSVYRQLGIGCERLWRQLIIDQLGIPAHRAEWSYAIPTAAGQSKTLKLDARIDRSDVAKDSSLERVDDWLQRAAAELGASTTIEGAVFEVRQGYKSKDSKRQNADIDNASHALIHDYIPTATILSMQMDTDIQLRYRQNNWVVLVGDLSSTSDLRSCFAFSDTVLQFDLAAFFERNTESFRSEVESTIDGILDPQ